MTTFVKDPQAILDYSINWDDGYLEADENLVTSTWTIQPAGELATDSTSNTAKLTTVFASGGVFGQIYSVVNRIVTDKGRTDDRSIWIRCFEPR